MTRINAAAKGSTSGGGGASTLTIVGPKTANYSANANEWVLFDTSVNDSPQTLTLPTTPTNGTVVAVQLIGGGNLWGSDYITIAAGGTDKIRDVPNLATTAAPVTSASIRLNDPLSVVFLQYLLSTTTWEVHWSHDILALESVFDSRYVSGSQAATGFITGSFNVGFSGVPGSVTYSLLATGQKLTPTAVKTSNYTAVRGDLIICDTSGGAFTVSLPTGAGRTDGDRIGIYLYKSGSTLTVQGNAVSNPIRYNGSAASGSVPLTHTDEFLVVQWDGTNSLWNLINHDGTSTGGSGITLTPTTTKTANYTAAANEFVVLDAGSSGFTLTLPSAPADGTVVGASLIVATNSVTVAAGAGDTISVGMQTSLNSSRRYYLYVYRASTTSWVGLTPLSNAVLTAGAFDTSIVAHGSSTAVTFTTGTLDAIAAAQPAAADWSNNSHKITSVTDPTNAQDVATKNYVDTHAGSSFGFVMVGTT